MSADYLKTLAAKCGAGTPLFFLKAAQMLALYALKRNGPGYFMQARFWRRSMKFREMLQHHGAAEYKKAVNALNDVGFQKLSQHKLAEKALMSLRAVPTPRFLGFFHRERGGDANGKPLRTEQELHAFLAENVGQRLCFKKAEGSGGSAFSALDVREHEGHIVLDNGASGERLSVSELFARLCTFKSGSMIEDYLIQHPQLAILNPDSVNTLRIIVMRTAAGFSAHGAILRVGRKGSQVDNTSNGGLACPVDLATGRVVESMDLSAARRNYERHPDSGAQLVGLVVPHWQACLDLACAALAAVPRMNFAGADIAVTDRGPSVIELNVDPDRRFATHLDLPHRRLFELFPGIQRQ